MPLQSARREGVSPDACWFSAIIPPELQHEERSILERLRRGERIDHYETVRVTKHGRRIDISVTISSIRDGAGRVIGASKVARDITNRKRAAEALQQREQHLRLITDATPALISVQISFTDS